MNISILKNAVVSFVFLSTGTAMAAPFCVGNSTGAQLTWSIDSGDGGLAPFVNTSHSPSQEWACIELEDNQTYTLEVSVPSLKYVAESCVVRITGDQWVRALPPSPGSKAPFNCEHGSDAGIMDDVKMELPDSASSYIVTGNVQLDGPVRDATLKIYSAEGKLLATHSRATSANGMFRVKVPTPKLANLRVEASGGTLKGSLSATIDADFELESDFLMINPVTTLAASYARIVPGIALAAANERARRFLDLSPRGPLATAAGFSATLFAKEAATHGGLDKYTQQLAREMARSEASVQAFAPPALLKGFGVDDIIEKLLEAMAEQIAMGAFDQMREGSAWASDTQKIFGILKVFDQRLSAIEKQLTKIESEILKLDYKATARKLWDAYGEIAQIRTNVELWNKMLQDNIDPVTKKPKKQSVVDEAKVAAATAQAGIIAKSMNFVRLVNSQFVTGTDIDSMSSVFVEYNLLQKNIVDIKFLDLIESQVGMYKLYQGVALGLLSEALVSTPTAREIAKQEGAGYLNYKVSYPTKYMIFRDLSHVKDVRDGKTIYEYPTGRIWDTHFTRYERCSSIISYRKNMKAGNSNIAYRDNMRQLYGSINYQGNWAAVMKSVGMNAAEADSKKMIVFSCDTADTEPYRSNENYDSIFWFGNDRGPWDDYYDRFVDYRRVRDGKGMSPGLWVMTYRDYGR